MLIIAVLAAVLGGPAPSSAVEISLHASAIQKMLLEQAFDQKARKYLYGDPTSPCMSGFLSDPVISISGGRIRLKTRFTGFLAREFDGQCLGLNDDFEVTMSGVPYFREGVFGLEKIEFGEMSRIPQFNEYISRFLDNELRHLFTRDLDREVREAIAANSGPTTFETDLINLDISRISALDDLLKLQVDFDLILK